MAWGSPLSDRYPRVEWRGRRHWGGEGCRGWLGGHQVRSEVRPRTMTDGEHESMQLAVAVGETLSRPIRATPLKAFSRTLCSRLRATR
eukprot:scaffold1124_cov131-Isochrysis_galbana.AAC.10